MIQPFFYCPMFCREPKNKAFFYFLIIPAKSILPLYFFRCYCLNRTLCIIYLFMQEM